MNALALLAAIDRAAADETARRMYPAIVEAAVRRGVTLPAAYDTLSGEEKDAVHRGVQALMARGVGA